MVVPYSLKAPSVWLDCEGFERCNPAKVPKLSACKGPEDLLTQMLSSFFPTIQATKSKFSNPTAFGFQHVQVFVT